jgi:hypothetical protein
MTEGDEGLIRVPSLPPENLRVSRAAYVACQLVQLYNECKYGPIVFDSWKP